jgi:hypothetical protein
VGGVGEDLVERLSGLGGLEEDEGGSALAEDVADGAVVEGVDGGAFVETEPALDVLVDEGGGGFAEGSEDLDGSLGLLASGNGVVG